jgi:hypothetical protein
VELYGPSTIHLHVMALKYRDSFAFSLSPLLSLLLKLFVVMYKWQHGGDGDL